jgi:hypothetical protein
VRASPRLPTWLLHLAAAAAIGALTWLIFSRAFLNYDTLYGLIWGRDLAHGRTPEYELTLAPTPHPLVEAVGIPLSLLGKDGAYTAMLALALVAWGALVWGVFLLGRECFGWPVGALAAVVVATRDPFLSQAVRAYVDIPFLALVVAAAVLEVRRPRRGLPVLLLLGLAGLLRPEAWLLGAAYWVYLYLGSREAPIPRVRGFGRISPESSNSMSGRRAALLALVVAAPPLLWALSDLAITGEPFHSLTFTRDTAETLGRPQGIENVPEIMPRRLGEILRWVPLVGGTVGFFLALRLARRRAALPAALAVLGGLAFVAIGIAGLSLLGRYLFLPAAMVAIFFGFAAFGWLDRPRDRAWRWWAAGAAVLLIAFVGSTISHQTDRLDRLHDGVQLRGEIQDDLRELTRIDAAEPLLEQCAPVYVPNHRPVPILAWYLDRDPEAFVSAQLELPRTGLYVAPRTDEVEQKFVLDPRDPKRFEIPRRPAGFRPVAVNESWILYERGCG